MSTLTAKENMEMEFFNAYSRQIWNLSFISLALVILTSTIINKIVKNRKSNMEKLAFEFLSMLLNQGINNITSQTKNIYPILICWLFMSFIFMNMFSGLLGSLLIVKPTKFMNTFKELEKDKQIEAYFWGGFNTEKLLKKEHEMIFKKGVRVTWSDWKQHKQMYYAKLFSGKIAWIESTSNNKIWKQLFLEIPLKISEEQTHFTISMRFPVFRSWRYFVNVTKM